MLSHHGTQSLANAPLPSTNSMLDPSPHYKRCLLSQAFLAWTKTTSSGNPERSISKRTIVDAQTNAEKREPLYAQMANNLLQLSALKFSQIGPLVEDESDGSASIKGRSLIANMNDIVVHTNAQPCILPSQVYGSASL